MPANIMLSYRKENLPQAFSIPEESLHMNLLLLRDFDFENLTFLIENTLSENMCSLLNLHENDLACERGKLDFYIFE